MSLSAYKGVRDFYPEDERVQRYLFNVMKKVVELHGYEEMNASILEPTELYASKTSEEIIRDQTYTFIDRGERSVTLRPEMTPTVARMVAARRRDLGFPLRWYSVQNFFRYERPQRGRLREFWQLNADLFGASDAHADAEVILLAYRIMKAYGATAKDYTIRISHRGIFDILATRYDIDAERSREIIRHFDVLGKMDAKAWRDELGALAGAHGAAYEALTEGVSDDLLQASGLASVLDALREAGMPSDVLQVDASLARGFDYYTGTVFEVFDKDPNNPRAVAGGGRYDRLIESYGGESTPAVGFAMGDVVIRDFLETHGLLAPQKPATTLYLAPVTNADVDDAVRAAAVLRERGVSVSVGLIDKKVGDHIKAALKLSIPYFVAYGAKERESGIVDVKNLTAETVASMTLDAVSEYVAS